MATQIVNNIPTKEVVDIIENEESCLRHASDVFGQLATLIICAKEGKPHRANLLDVALNLAVEWENQTDLSRENLSILKSKLQAVADRV